MRTRATRRSRPHTHQCSMNHAAIKAHHLSQSTTASLFFLTPSIIQISNRQLHQRSESDYSGLPRAARRPVRRVGGGHEARRPTLSDALATFTDRDGMLSRWSDTPSSSVTCLGTPPTILLSPSLPASLLIHLHTYHTAHNRSSLRSGYNEFASTRLNTAPGSRTIDTTSEETCEGGHTNAGDEGGATHYV
ncbi:hypothetical protein E2C01_003326 [Portunus trituberculatus]|uniref:Uncharacterized protein n=1 Tax=Portunus trituberculatus TaxID=210409 RepID=A0A5B7CPW2_PORTR|nr:hypothetical protein [Portunus trituberculatus]